MEPDQFFNENSEKTKNKIRDNMQKAHIHMDGNSDDKDLILESLLLTCIIKKYLAKSLVFMIFLALENES